MKEPSWLVRMVEQFDKKTEELVARAELHGLPLEELQSLWGLPVDDPMLDCFPVHEEQARHLENRTELAFDLRRYDYFLSAFARDFQAARRDGGFMGAYPAPLEIEKRLGIRAVKPKTPSRRKANRGRAPQP